MALDKLSNILINIKLAPSQYIKTIQYQEKIQHMKILEIQREIEKEDMHI